MKKIVFLNSVSILLNILLILNFFVSSLGVSLAYDQSDLKDTFNGVDYKIAGPNWVGNLPTVNFISPTSNGSKIQANSSEYSFVIETTLDNSDYFNKNFIAYLEICKNNTLTCQLSDVNIKQDLSFSDSTDVQTLIFGDLFNGLVSLPFDGVNRIGIVMFRADTIAEIDSSTPRYRSRTELPFIEINLKTNRVYRFYSDVYQGHFYTNSISERDSVRQNNSNWTYEPDPENSMTFSVIPYDRVTNSCEVVNAVPVHRFWSDIYNRHFYTVNEQELNDVKNNPEWNLYNGIVFCAFNPNQFNNSIDGYVDVYRFWNNVSGGHFYTKSDYEKRQLEKHNASTWKYELVGFSARK